MRKLIILKDGDIFNRWIIINNSIIKEDKKSRVLCRCQCGTERLVRVDDLTKDRSRSCGCLNNEISKKRGDLLYEQTRGRSGAFRNLIKSYVTSAEKKGLSWELSDDFVYEITQKNCYYCNQIPSQVKRARARVYIFNGIDRVINTVGYVVNNVVPCCWDCNVMKSDKSKEVFLNEVLKIFKFSINKT